MSLRQSALPRAIGASATAKRQRSLARTAAWTGRWAPSWHVNHMNTRCPRRRGGGAAASDIPAEVGGRLGSRPPGGAVRRHSSSLNLDHQQVARAVRATPRGRPRAERGAGSARGAAHRRAAVFAAAHNYACDETRAGALNRRRLWKLPPVGKTSVPPPTVTGNTRPRPARGTAPTVRGDGGTTFAHRAAPPLPAPCGGGQPQSDPGRPSPTRPTASVTADFSGRCCRQPRKNGHSAEAGAPQTQ